MECPFVFKFKSDKENFIYDVNTNNILKVDNSLYDLVDQLNGKSGPELLNNFKGLYSSQTIEKVADEIKRNKEERGLFLEKRPLKMFFPFSREEYKVMLDNLLNHVILNVAEDCNNRCEYCKYSGEYIYSRTHNEKYMEEAVAIRAVKFMLERSNYILKNTDQNCSVGFYGGEPLLNFKVIKACINYINENFCSIRDRINFSMTTNLTILNDEIIDFLISNNFSLLVSLDGPEEIHDRYRKSKSGKGTFSNIMNNLKRIKERNDDYYENKIGFSIVLAPPYDLHSIKEFFEKVDFLAKRIILLSFIDPEDTNFFDRFKDLDKINEDANIQLGELKKEYKQMVTTEERDSAKYKFLSGLFEDRVRDIYRRYILQLSERIYPNGICLPGVQKFLVSPEGKFYICEKIGYSFPIGDIYNGFDNAGIFSLIDEYIKISESVCLSCWAVRFCKACFLKAMKGDRLDAETKKKIVWI